MLTTFGSFCFERLHIGLTRAVSPGVCFWATSLQTLSAFGSSLVRQNLDSPGFLFFFPPVFLLQSSAASDAFGSNGSRLGRAGLVLAVVNASWLSIEPVGPGSEVAAGRQAVPVGLAVWLMLDVYSVGRARVCFQDFGHCSFP